MSGVEKELSVTVNEGGKSHKVTLTAGASAPSAAIDAEFVMVYSTVDCFVRAGANPTALADGTDQFIPANTLLRLDGINRSHTGSKLAFISASAGTVYITPGA